MYYFFRISIWLFIAVWNILDMKSSRETMTVSWNVTEKFEGGREETWCMQ